MIKLHPWTVSFDIAMLSKVFDLHKEIISPTRYGTEVEEWANSVTMRFKNLRRPCNIFDKKCLVSSVMAQHERCPLLNVVFTRVTSVFQNTAWAGSWSQCRIAFFQSVGCSYNKLIVPVGSVISASLAILLFVCFIWGVLQAIWCNQRQWNF